MQAHALYTAQRLKTLSKRVKPWLDWCARHPPPKITFEENVLTYEISYTPDEHLDRLTIAPEGDHFIVTVDLGWHWLQIRPATLKIGRDVLEVFGAGQLEFSLMIGNEEEPLETHFFVFPLEHVRRSFPRESDCDSPTLILRTAMDAWFIKQIA